MFTTGVKDADDTDLSVCQLTAPTVKAAVSTHTLRHAVVCLAVQPHADAQFVICVYRTSAHAQDCLSRDASASMSTGTAQGPTAAADVTERRCATGTGRTVRRFPAAMLK